MKHIDMIVPCFNEQDVLELFYSEVQRLQQNCVKYSFRFIFVDDGSSDNTLSIVKKFAETDDKIKFISFSRNFGKEAAMLAGLRAADGDYIGIIDADLQHSPDLIIPMAEALDEGYDVSAAQRVDREGESKIKSAFSKMFYGVMDKLSDVKINQGAQDFRLMKKKVVDAILSMPESIRFSKGIFSWVGFNVKYFNHENRERAAGKSKFSLFKLLKYAFDGIVGFSTSLLRLSLFVGAISSIAGIIYALYFIVRTLVHGPDVAGYPSIFTAILIIGGLILICLGIIGEYLARVYIEVKHRPVYIVNETNIFKQI